MTADPRKEAPTNIFAPTQLPVNVNASMKTSLDDSNTVTLNATEKPSMADLPNFQAYYKDLFEENARLRTKDDK